MSYFSRGIDLKKETLNWLRFHFEWLNIQLGYINEAVGDEELSEKDSLAIHDLTKQKMEIMWEMESRV